MSNMTKIIINVILIVVFCISLFSCGIPVETSKGSFLVIEDTDTFRRNQKDPSRMTQEVEQDRREETMRNIEKQNKKEEAVREKYFNEIIDKQLQNKEGMNH